MFKKIITFLFLFSALSAYAYTSDPSSGFEVLLEGFYLKPNSDFLTYAATQPREPTPPFNPIFIKKIAPQYDLGYGASIAYRFPCSCNDIKLHWQILNTQDHDHYAATSEEALEIPFVLNSGLRFELANAQVKFHYSVGELNVGRYFNYSRCFLSRFYAGLKYSCIERNFNFRLQDALTPAPSPIDSLDLDSKIRVKGVGPQVGINTIYYFVPCFGLESDFAVAGLYQNAKTSFRTLAGFVDDGGTFVTSISPDDQKRVTPVIDAKLGLQYHYQSCSGTAFKGSAGWQYAYYIGEFNEVILATNMSGISSTDFRKIDASFQGPYVNVAVKF